MGTGVPTAGPVGYSIIIRTDGPARDDGCLAFRTVLEPWPLSTVTDGGAADDVGVDDARLHLSTYMTRERTSSDAEAQSHRHTTDVVHLGPTGDRTCLTHSSTRNAMNSATADNT